MSKRHPKWRDGRLVKAAVAAVLPILCGALMPTAVAALLLSGAADAFSGPPTTIPIGGGHALPYLVGVGDVNGDGKPDIVSASGMSDEVAIFLGAGDGSFRPGKTYAIGKGLLGAGALADLNQDGTLDIVTASYQDRTLTVLLGDGAGGFAPAHYSPIHVPGTPTGLAVADFDRNGWPDLLVTVTSLQSPPVAIVLRGTASGISASGTPEFVVGAYPDDRYFPVDVVVGDFNKDDKLDVAVLNGMVLIFQGVGDGTFEAVERETIHLRGFLDGFHADFGEFARSLSLGDVDGDGFPDLAVGTEYIGGTGQLVSESYVRIYFGMGAFFFSPAFKSVRNDSRTLRFCRLGDVNGDGKLDLVTIHYLDVPRAVVYLGDGKRGFTQAAAFRPAGFLATGLALADVSGDGKADIVVTSEVSPSGGTLHVLLGARDGVPTNAPGSPIATAAGPRSVGIGDVDHDGLLDIVTGNIDRTVSVLRGARGGRFVPAPGSPFDTSLDPLTVQLADVDGDGNLDLVVGAKPGFEIFIGDGRGRFVPARGSPPVLPREHLYYSDPYRSVFADLDGDGRVDLVHRAEEGGGVEAFLGNGDGSFGAPIPCTVPGEYSWSLAVADMNRDGAPDLVLFQSAGKGRQLSVRLGNLTGSFRSDPGSLPVSVPTAYPWLPPSDIRLATANLNGDEMPDVLLGAQTFFGDGHGGLLAGPSNIVYVGHQSLIDLDGDGRVDALFTSARYPGPGQSSDNFLSTRLFVALGDGRGGFSAAEGSPFDLHPAPTAFADLDGRGFVDGVAVGPKGVSIYRQIRLDMSPATLPPTSVGTRYRQRLSASGGTPPYAFRLTAGDLPAGIELTGDGTLTGAARACGTAFFTVTATDAKGVVGRAAYVIAVSAGGRHDQAVDPSPANIVEPSRPCPPSI